MLSKKKGAAATRKGGRVLSGLRVPDHPVSLFRGIGRVPSRVGYYLLNVLSKKSESRIAKLEIQVTTFTLSVTADNHPNRQTAGPHGGSPKLDRSKPQPVNVQDLWLFRSS